jgi:transposase-like protein
MGKQRRRQFTEEFKAKAVDLVRSSGKAIPEVARDLGLVVTSLRNWFAQAQIDAGPGHVGALTSEERQELAALRKENRILKEEREILKKAAAFFAKENR